MATDTARSYGLGEQDEPSNADLKSQLLQGVNTYVDDSVAGQFTFNVSYNQCNNLPFTRRISGYAWLSDSATDATATSTPADGLTAATGTALVRTVTAGTLVQFVSNAGSLGLVVAYNNTGEADQTWYLWVTLDDRVFVSPALTFPAPEA